MVSGAIEIWLIDDSNVWPLSSNGFRRIQLNLNPDKTEFLLIGNERQRSKYLSMFPIELFGVKTNPAKSARNLGVIFDKTYKFRSHISAACISCFYHMRDLERIRCHLDLDRAKLLAIGLVFSHLDYCNSLLYGIADIDICNDVV